MARTAPVKGGGDFPIPESGWHVFRASHFIDIGTQKTVFNGDEKHMHKVLYGFTLVNTEESGLAEFGLEKAPFVVWQRYTFSMSEKANLRKFLEDWRGQKFTDEEAGKFDVVVPVEKAVAGYMNIVHNPARDGSTKVYANIGGVGKLPKGMTAQPLPADPVVFDLDKPNWDVFETFSDNLKKTIQASPEYQQSKTSRVPGEDREESNPTDEDFDPNEDATF